MSGGLHEPFESLPRQREASEFGLWIFLASEAVFFGGLFLGYTIYRWLYPSGFDAAGAETNIYFGTINTALLLTSSATMAAAVWAGEARMRRGVLVCLGLTAALGLAFLALKALEYREDLHKHLVPGSVDFPLSEPGAQLFFSFYWAMTAIHAVHLTVGIGAVGTTLWRIARRHAAWRETNLLHTLGLYWHLVDLIWIFLYPLLYLLGR